MVSRYRSAILRHGLDFGGRDTPATTILKPTRAPGNNSGLGPPSVARPSAPTATQLVDVPTVASRGEAVAMEPVEQGCRSHLSRERPLKGFTSRELRHRGQARWREAVVDRCSNRMHVRQQVPHWWSLLIRASGSSHPLVQRLRGAKVIAEVLSQESKIWVPTQRRFLQQELNTKATSLPGLLWSL